jgi:hypothetical protein
LALRELNRGIKCGNGSFLDRHFADIGAALATVVRACEIDQDSPHMGGCYRKKVNSVPPIDLSRMDQAQVGFVQHLTIFPLRSPNGWTLPMPVLWIESDPST